MGRGRGSSPLGRGRGGAYLFEALQAPTQPSEVVVGVYFARAAAGMGTRQRGVWSRDKQSGGGVVVSLAD